MHGIRNSVFNQYLDCTDCMGTTRVSDVFDIAFGSWPQQMWIAYRCPTCATVNHIAVRPNTVTEGYIDGAPEPCLVPTRTIGVPSMRVTATNNGIQIRALNLSWNILASA